METKIYNIETTTELGLVVQKAKCSIIDEHGKHAADDEICLLIEGYSSESNESIAEFVCISKKNALKLIEVLKELTSKAA